MQALIERYRRFRGYGHSPFIAAALATPLVEWLTYILCGIVGLYVGSMLAGWLAP